MVSTPAAIACRPTCAATFVAGTPLSLLAVPDAGSSFDRWTGCPSTTFGAVCSTTVTGPLAIEATFCPRVASAAAIHYVDNTRGSDDTSHGGGPGPCALRTISYALTRATGQIRVAAGTYGAASAELFPLTLTNSQSLVCPTGSARAVIEGPSTNTPRTLELLGTGNTVRNCVVRPAAPPAVGNTAVVVHVGTQGSHQITSCEIDGRGAAAGLTVLAGARVDVTSTAFIGSARNLFWNSGAMAGSPGATGTMTNNTFSGSSTRDIECSTSAATTQIIGSGNTRAGGPVLCLGCSNCPF